MKKMSLKKIILLTPIDHRGGDSCGECMLVSNAIKNDLFKFCGRNLCSFLRRQKLLMMGNTNIHQQHQ